MKRLRWLGLLSIALSMTGAALAEREVHEFRFNRKAAVREAVKELERTWTAGRDSFDAEHDLARPFVSGLYAPDCSGAKKKVVVVTFQNAKRPESRAFIYFELLKRGRLDFIACGGGDDGRPNAAILEEVREGGPWVCGDDD